MSDTKLIDLTNFLSHRPEPQNINCVTDNDIKISIICALAESKGEWVKYDTIWRPAFSYLKLTWAKENRTGFYDRADAIVSSLVGQGVAALHQTDTGRLVMLKPGYPSVLRSAILLYNECTQDTSSDDKKTVSTKEQAVQVQAPVMEKAPAEKEPVPVSLGALKITFLKWLDEQIDYATWRKEDPHREVQDDTFGESEAKAKAFIDVKNEFTGLFSIKNREYTGGLLSQWCSSCGWKGKNLRIEITKCPDCGKEVDGDCRILFGGTEIIYRKSRNRFYLRSPTGEKDGVIYDADYQDAILFILKHSTMSLE